MVDPKTLFMDGEHQLGRYMVGVLTETEGNWHVSLVQLDGVVTNYRLMLRPMRRRYAPACLPRHYLKAIDLTQQGHRHAVRLQLITGDCLHLVVSTGTLNDLFRDLKAMRKPPRYQFDEAIARRDVERLVHFFAHDARPAPFSLH